jgi:predicted DNA-binding protein with PD1-like motif
MTGLAKSKSSCVTMLDGMRGVRLAAARCLSLLVAGALAFLAVCDAAAQAAAAPQATPEGYVPRGLRPGKGLAPGLQVTDLGKSGRTYRVSMKKGDEIMSGLTEFAEKYGIKNAHFTALGAVNKGLFGWADVESGLGQKKIELNQEAEIVSFMGDISVDSQGRSIVHGHGSVSLSDGSVKGGHWWSAYVSIIAVVFVTEEEGAAEASK